VTLAAHLREHHDRLGTLLGLLGRERTLLGEGRVDGEALAALAAEKQDVLSELADGEQRGRATWAALGCRDAPDKEEQAARQQGCLELWRQMRGRAREAARLNHFNGELIRVRLTHNQHLLNDLQSLRGRFLYGPDGHTQAANARVVSHA
jgi:flagella synthesis protein FlgN